MYLEEFGQFSTKTRWFGVGQHVLNWTDCTSFQLCVRLMKKQAANCCWMRASEMALLLLIFIESIGDCFSHMCEHARRQET